MTASSQSSTRRGFLASFREVFSDTAAAVGRPARGMKRPGYGHPAFVPALPESEATSNQICGLWPWSAGAGYPMVGAPLGRHLEQMATVCADPVSWFLKGMITNPSMFVLGQPGLGKSSLIRHMLTIMAAWGIRPLVLSDLKPDYVDLGEQLDCTVVRVGLGLDVVNPLDAGPIRDVLPHLATSRRAEIVAQVSGRRLNALVGLVELVRGSRLEDFESNILKTALQKLDPTLENPPVIDDVIALIEGKDPMVRSVVRDRDDPTRYLDRTEDLLDSLQVLGSNGSYGGTFSSQTSFKLDPDRGAVMDMHEVDDQDMTLQAALQLTCWSYGSAVVHSAKIAAEAGIAPERLYVLVMDELWRALRASELLVDRIDAITRLNRQLLFPQIMCTHTMADLRLSTEAATTKAWGFVERSAMVFLGGLSPKEMGNLAEVFSMPVTEQRMVNGWADTRPIKGDANDSDDTGRNRARPPGQGKFLLKLGDSAGVPFELLLSPLELGVNDTNRRWASIR